MSGPADSQMTLSAEMRSVARARILRAARAVLVRQGFDSTVDDIASEAGVSRRTVFRYFPSHGQLLSAAVAELLDEMADVPEAPTSAADVDGWLLETATRLHTFNAEQVGRAFWDINAGRAGASPELAEVLDRRLRERSELALTIAQHAWRSAGGQGLLADWVVDVFLLQLSGFAHHGFQARERRSPAETASLSAKVLSAVLSRALQEQRQERT